MIRAETAITIRQLLAQNRQGAKFYVTLCTDEQATCRSCGGRNFKESYLYHVMSRDGHTVGVSETCCLYCCGIAEIDEDKPVTMYGAMIGIRNDDWSLFCARNNW